MNSPRIFSLRSLTAFVAGALLSLTPLPTRADSASWISDPVSGDWNTAGNWSPATVPERGTDTATFDVSNTTAIAISHGVELNGLVFNPGASAYTITASAISFGTDVFTVSGLGIDNRSGVKQRFVIAAMDGVTPVEGRMQFRYHASAGIHTLFVLKGASVSFGLASFLVFWDNSRAINSIFVLDGGSAPFASGGIMEWHSTGTPGQSAFICNGGSADNAAGGYAEFDPVFLDHVTLIANGGVNGASGGGIVLTNVDGNAQVKLFGNGTLSLAGKLPASTIGSLEGEGSVNIEGGVFTVGSNDLSTVFSGVITSIREGTVVKTGTGTLTLSNASTYPGHTRISSGRLVVINTTGSATGTGPILVEGGILAGTGQIAGPVTVGLGPAAAILAPGLNSGTGSLTILGSTTFESLATYKVELDSDRVAADQTVSNGVTIDSAAELSLADLGSASLPAGTVFTIVNNTAASQIAGTFGNLPDGATVTVGSNTYQANYEGGDGNDLTLTVVQGGFAP